MGHFAHKCKTSRGYFKTWCWITEEFDGMGKWLMLYNFRRVIDKTYNFIRVIDYLLINKNSSKCISMILFYFVFYYKFFFNKIFILIQYNWHSFQKANKHTNITPSKKDIHLSKKYNGHSSLNIYFLYIKLIWISYFKSIFHVKLIWISYFKSESRVKCYD